jgi:hypothetical protein
MNAGQENRPILLLIEEDALAKVGGGHVPDDLVLLNLVGKSAVGCLAIELP